MKINKKQIIKNSIILLLMIGIIAIITLYVCNETVRNVIDHYVFRKEITEEQTTSIDLSGGDNPFVYAYDKYIVVLNDGILSSYVTSGNKAFTNELLISNPIFASNERFLCVAENGGSKIYLLSGENIVWQQDVEGNISKVNVNKNGYVSVIVKGTSYKSIIVTFNDKGKELFKTYLSSTNAIQADISNDNKYLAIAEVNSSGSIVQSYVKLISIQKAESEPTNSVVYTYKAEVGSLITNIKYQDRGKLVCMYNDSIQVIENEESQEILKVDADTQYMDINLKNAILNARVKQKGIFNNAIEILIKNINNQTESLYTIDSTINFIETQGENIAINMGSDVHFINTSGWLLKKYTANQEITNIVLGNSIAGIVYRNKIDVINL